MRLSAKIESDLQPGGTVEFAPDARGPASPRFIRRQLEHRVIRGNGTRLHTPPSNTAVGTFGHARVGTPRGGRMPEAKDWRDFDFLMDQLAETVPAAPSYHDSTPTIDAVVTVRYVGAVRTIKYSRSSPAAEVGHAICVACGMPSAAVTRLVDPSGRLWPLDPKTLPEGKQLAVTIEEDLAAWMENPFHLKNSDLDKEEKAAAKVHNKAALRLEMRRNMAMAMFRAAPTEKKDDGMPFDYMSPRQKRRFAAQVAENCSPYRCTRVGMKKPPPNGPPLPLPPITVCSTDLGEQFYRTGMQRELARCNQFGPRFTGQVDQTPWSMKPVG